MLSQVPEKSIASQGGQVDKSADFDPQTLAQMANYSTEELSRVEKGLAKEFKSISRQYIEARLSRIHKLIEQSAHLIKVAYTNDKNWLKIYNFEIETINNIKTNTEDLILMNSGVIRNKYDLLKSIDEYEEELKEIFKNLQSPLAFDDTLKVLESGSLQTQELSKLPFSYLFQNVFQPHIQNLRSIVNEKDYQSRLLSHNSQGNSAIIWKQYYHNLVRRKQELIDKTSDELNSLYKEYHHINQQHVNKTHWKHYFNSVISINDLKPTAEGEPVNSINTHNTVTLLSHSNDPSYANLDNQYLLNNKIESTVTKINILQGLNRFDQSQNRSKDLAPNSRKRIKLNSCLGLTGDEIDSDILALRLAMPEKIKPSSPVQETTEEKDIIQEAEDVDGTEMETIYYKGTEVDVIDDYSGDDVEDDMDLDELDDVDEFSDDDEDGDDDDQLSEAEEKEEEEEEENIEKKNMKLKYKQLLETNASSSRVPSLYPSRATGSSPFPIPPSSASFFFPSLPPLEKFPKLGGA
jgi:hypothetical protein